MMPGLSGNQVALDGTPGPQQKHLIPILDQLRFGLAELKVETAAITVGVDATASMLSAVRRDLEAVVHILSPQQFSLFGE